MDYKSLLAILCSLLLVCAPVAESANTQAIGTLTSAGAAQVNGSVMPTGTAIFVGDRIVNSDAANIALSLSGGSRLVLAGAGSLQIQQTTHQPTALLEKGSLAVLTHTSAAIAVEAAGTRITSRDGDAVYGVTVDGNNLQVTASKGRAEVEGAGRTLEVPEGKTLMAKMMPPERREPQVGAPPAAAGGGVSRFFTFQHVILIVAAAGALAALALAIREVNKTCRVNNTVSPAKVSCD